MNPSNQTYDQPEKNTARERIVKAAVKALTDERSSSPVVTVETFGKTLDYCCRVLDKRKDGRLSEDLKPHIASWLGLRNARIGTKKPSELQVLFLAGPDPVNDLMMFKHCGVAIENIWAIEKEKTNFALAVKASERHGIRVKLHRGSLESFFAVVPQQFDIVYFDAMAPFFGGRPNTFNVIRELFLNQRLSPLSVLVTNFADVAKDSENADAWAKRIGNWVYANGTDDTWTNLFPDYVCDQVVPHLQQYYGEFITKFLIQFSAQMVPWWRVVALPGAKKEYFNDSKMLSDAAAKADASHLMSSALYPLLRQVVFSDWNLDKSDPVFRLFFEKKLGEEKETLGDAVKASSLVRTFYETHFDGVWGSTKHVLDACSPNLARVLGSFKWFDERSRFFCDVPMPNLIADLLFGLYGFPYHTNAQKIERFAYKAKETVMFTDIMILDQARYMYDLLPTLPLFETDFSVPQQLVLRVCMDAVHRHCHYGCKDIFWGSALAGLGENGFTVWIPGARECIGDPGVTFNEPDADGYEVSEEI
jgi:hypothetical protein